MTQQQTIICFPDATQRVYLVSFPHRDWGMVIRETDGNITVRWEPYKYGNSGLPPGAYVYFPERETEYKVTGSGWRKRIGEHAQTFCDLTSIADPKPVSETYLGKARFTVPERAGRDD